MYTQTKYMIDILFIYQQKKYSFMMNLITVKEPFYTKNSVTQTLERQTLYSAIIILLQGTVGNVSIDSASSR